MTSTDAARPVRDLGPEDVPAIFSLSRAVGWPHREEDLRLLLTLGRGYAATGPDGAPEACALWWPLGPAVATIGLVIVRPDLQGRGTGRLLMRRLLEAAGPRRVHLHATEAGRDLYGRLGFVACGLVRQHQGVARPDPETAGEAGVRPMRPDDRPSILALDAAALDADRTALVDAVAAVGRGFVHDEGGRVTGYAFLRGFGRGLVLGPVVAETGPGGLALLRAGTAAAAGSFLRVDTPMEEDAVRRELARAGLPEVATALPMVRAGLAPGGAVLPAGPARPAGGARVYGLAAQALG